MCKFAMPQENYFLFRFQISSFETSIPIVYDEESVDICATRVVKFIGKTLNAVS